jgi:hypothetical protein
MLSNGPRLQLDRRNKLQVYSSWISSEVQLCQSFCYIFVFFSCVIQLFSCFVFYFYFLSFALLRSFPLICIISYHDLHYFLCGFSGAFPFNFVYVISQCPEGLILCRYANDFLPPRSSLSHVYLQSTSVFRKWMENLTYSLLNFFACRIYFSV